MLSLYRDFQPIACSSLRDEPARASLAAAPVILSDALARHQKEGLPEQPFRLASANRALGAADTFRTELDKMLLHARGHESRGGSAPAWSELLSIGNGLKTGASDDDIRARAKALEDLAQAYGVLVACEIAIDRLGAACRELAAALPHEKDTSPRQCRLARMNDSLVRSVKALTQKPQAEEGVGTAPLSAATNFLDKLRGIRAEIRNALDSGLTLSSIHGVLQEGGPDAWRLQTVLANMEGRLKEAALRCRPDGTVINVEAVRQVALSFDVIRHDVLEEEMFAFEFVDRLSRVGAPHAVTEPVHSGRTSAPAMVDGLMQLDPPSPSDAECPAFLEAAERARHPGPLMERAGR